MKFLKPYKLFESFPTKWSDMKYDIGDILLELQDDGMDMSSRPFNIFFWKANPLYP